MAEKAEKKPEAAPAAAKEHAEKKDDAHKPAAAGLLAKTPVLLGIVMVIEAVVLFAGFKFLGGGPKNAAAVEIKTEEESGHGGHGEIAGPKPSPEKDREIDVLQSFKARNVQSGRSFIYDLSVSIQVKAENEEKMKDKVKMRDTLIKDRIRTIIATMDPDKLGGAEPGLETLRRQIKSQLEIILGEGMIEEVLVPSCTPFRADF